MIATEVPLIDVRELSRRTGVAKSTLLDLVKAGRLPVVRFSERVIRFDWAAVRAALGLRPAGAGE